MLISVSVLVLVAAVFIPWFTNSRVAADEAAATQALREIHGAESSYASFHPDRGFTTELSTLGSAAQGGGEQTIDPVLASGRKSGYTFTYTPGERVNGAIRSYSVTAVPDQVGKSGQRRFFSDESGAVHYNASGPADVTSPVIQ